MSSSLAAAYDISPLLTPPLCRQRQIAVKVSQQLAPVCRAPLRGPYCRERTGAALDCSPEAHLSVSENVS
jgi:hypothetical protein